MWHRVTRYRSMQRASLCVIYIYIYIYIPIERERERYREIYTVYPVVHVSHRLAGRPCQRASAHGQASWPLAHIIISIIVIIVVSIIIMCSSIIIIINMIITCVAIMSIIIIVMFIVMMMNIVFIIIITSDILGTGHGGSCLAERAYGDQTSDKLVLVGLLLVVS